MSDFYNLVNEIGAELAVILHYLRSNSIKKRTGIYCYLTKKELIEKFPNIFTSDSVYKRLMKKLETKGYIERLGNIIELLD